MPKHSFSKIMLLAEGTEEGMEAARRAIQLAADQAAVLHIVSVVDTHTLEQLLTYRIFVEDEMRQYEQDLQESCQKQLDYVAQLATKRGVEYRTALLTGACHTSVLQEQRRIGAELLVMGAFRPSTVKTNLMASEKQLIINEIPCPVLLVPAVGAVRRPWT